MSAFFTNVCSVGAVSTVTGELVVRLSRSYSVSTATSELVELLRKKAEEDAAATQNDSVE